ncbi:hypothetical protein L7F22_010172 [Adiantum nelumboides]|nr:hypothetical protein [Adiantum nelumboides]
MRKWFNIKIVDDFSSDELSSDDDVEAHEEEGEEAQDIEGGEVRQLQAPKNPDCIWPLPDEPLTDWPVVNADKVQQQKESLNTEHLRIAVGIWNVAGRVPPKNLDLRDWLDSNGPVDIYVIGFQEIVPLTVGNVCGVDDIRPALSWQALIRKTINRLEYNLNNYIDCIKRPVALDNHNEQFLEDEAPEKPLLGLASNVSCTFSISCEKQAFYVRVASKQMVGIHISIWSIPDGGLDGVDATS